MTKVTSSHLASQDSLPPCPLSILEKSQFLRETMRAQVSLAFYDKVEGHSPAKTSAVFWLFPSIHNITSLFI